MQNSDDPDKEAPPAPRGDVDQSMGQAPRDAADAGEPLSRSASIGARPQEVPADTVREAAPDVLAGDQHPPPDAPAVIDAAPQSGSEDGPQELLRNYSRDYFQMNAGAHRRRAPSLNAPVLIWHRAFWISVPNTVDDPGLDIAGMEAARRKARSLCKKRIDDLILEFYRFLVESAGNVHGRPVIGPSVGDKIILFDKVVGGESFGVVAKPDPAVEDVLNSDNRVVTVKFNWDGIEVTARTELHTEYFTMTTFSEIGASATLTGDLAKLTNYLAHGGNADQIGGLRKFFFHQFWADRLDRMAKDNALEAVLTDPTFKDVFADFRGIVVSDRKPGPAADAPAAPPPAVSTTQDWGHPIALKLLPLFTQSERYECTASYMLNDRALYMTTLGPQLPETGLSELLPLEYILYVHEDGVPAGPVNISKWQLGGLADRIHLLGTVRLASLKYLPELREASALLVELSEYFKKARSDQTGTISAPDLQQVRHHFVGITRRFNQETHTDTGISYRIERSRYYVAQFNANIAPLRLRRLEGYQRYDEFIAYRLGPVFDFISRLGERYERAVNAMSLLEQSFLSIQTHELSVQTNRVATRAQEIADQTNQLATRTQEIDNDIRDIQAYGEVILLGALVPYYLTSLADHIVPHDWVRLLGMICFTVGFGSAAARFATYKESLRERRNGIGVTAGAVAALIMVLIFCYETAYPESPVGTEEGRGTAPSRHATDKGKNTSLDNPAAKQQSGKGGDATGQGVRPAGQSGEGSDKKSPDASPAKETPPPPDPSGDAWGKAVSIPYLQRIPEPITSGTAPDSARNPTIH
jgi:hypothetical protein